LRGFLAQGEARSLRFARYFRQGLQHALSKRRVVVVQQAFQIIGGQIFVVDRNHSLGQGVGVEVFLEAGHERVGKLFGARIIGLRILHAAAELLHSGVDKLLSEIFRAGDIHQLANAGFLLGIERA
jgi:hypothetical protein